MYALELAADVRYTRARLEKALATGGLQVPHAARCREVRAAFLALCVLHFLELKAVERVIASHSLQGEEGGALRVFGDAPWAAQLLRRSGKGLGFYFKPCELLLSSQYTEAFPYRANLSTLALRFLRTAGPYGALCKYLAALLTRLTESFSEEEWARLTRVVLLNTSPATLERVALYGLCTGSALSKSDPSGQYDSGALLSLLIARLTLTLRPAFKERRLCVLEPCIGQGALINALALLRKGRGEGTPFKVSAYELNALSAAVARLTLSCHSAVQVTVREENFLTAPVKERFDLILLNPPYAQRLTVGEGRSLTDFCAASHLSDLSALPWPSCSELPFVLKALSLLEEDGLMLILLPPGALTRPRADAALREALVTRFHLQACIALPRGLFKGVEISPRLLIFSTLKAEVAGERSCLCVNAQGRGGRLRSEDEEHFVESLVSLVTEGREYEGLSRKVSPEEFKRLDYNLNPLAYLTGGEEEQNLDLKAIATALSSLYHRQDKLREHMAEVFSQLEDSHA